MPTPPAEEVVETIVTPPVTETPAEPVVPVSEGAQEVVKGVVGSEEASGVLTGHTLIEEGPAGSLSAMSAPPGATPSAEAGAGISSAVISSAAAISGPSGPGEPPTASTKTALGALSRMTVSQRSGGLSCALSALEGPMRSNCATGWLTARSVVAAPVAALAAVVTPWTAVSATDAPAEGGHGGSGVGTRPSNPAPGPAPSGASGSSAAGGSGLALSAFLTLSGLLMLAAPCALCRLRLACRPWLTAFFVLIPERPG
ncbi:MAG: hypothetical protein H0X28_15205 [Solirubrobacterales bacterium]|nr:hypothetical protein [Solirubrobacterales bacterium]